MRGNDLRTLDAAQFPLDRLSRLQLAGNPLVCNCSLLWLWRLTTGQLNANDDTHPNAANNVAAAADGGSYHATNIQTKANTVLTQQSHGTSNSNILILDADEIACDLWKDSERHTRHLLKSMAADDIKCPAHIVTIVSAILSILLIVLIGGSVLYYIRVKNRKNAMSERKNVNERIVPQQVDKLELERYLAAQEMENEYRALRQWELTMKEQIEEPDHYEKFDEFRYDTRRTHKPHVVYV